MNVLVVAAHPDDEVLGCGGAIAAHKRSGDAVHVIFMTNGVSSRLTLHEKDVSNRQACAELALKVLGVESVVYCDFPDNSMDSLPLLAVVQKIEALIRKIDPVIIYTHHWNDLNVDHKITHQAVLTACRPLPGFGVREIFGFEVLSSTEWQCSPSSKFNPNMYVDISNTIELKIRALEAYQVEMRPAPHSRSIEHARILAKHRGYSIGLPFAEAFETYRCIRIS